MLLQRSCQKPKGLPETQGVNFNNNTFNIITINDAWGSTTKVS
jgi:hypothetical protein